MVDKQINNVIFTILGYDETLMLFVNSSNLTKHFMLFETTGITSNGAYSNRVL